MLARLAATAALFTISTAASAAILTDISLFSSNAEGNNWNGLLWNTEGPPDDWRGNWNLYVSTDPLSDTSPTFVNSADGPSTPVALPVAVGTTTYSIYGEGVGGTFEPAQHFVLNLYFDAVQSAPRISGVQSLANDALAAAGHPNGLSIFGDAGHPEAGTLSTRLGNLRVTLTSFSWITDGNRDVVWDHWANDDPYSRGSGRADYYGSFTLDVRGVPLPGTLPLLFAAAVAGFATRRRR